MNSRNAHRLSCVFLCPYPYPYLAHGAHHFPECSAVCYQGSASPPQLFFESWLWMDVGVMVMGMRMERSTLCLKKHLLHSRRILAYSTPASQWSLFQILCFWGSRKCRRDLKKKKKNPQPTNFRMGASGCSIWVDHELWFCLPVPRASSSVEIPSRTWCIHDLQQYLNVCVEF